jgi:hypothetical protein
MMSSDLELRFQTLTPLGFNVRVTERYWQIITTVKHPVMTGRETDVQITLQQPELIRQSRSDASVFLFYRPERLKRWICAVVKRRNGDGFLITTYITDAIKEGVHIWPR